MLRETSAFGGVYSSASPALSRRESLETHAALDARARDPHHAVMSVFERWHEEKQSAWLYLGLAKIEDDAVKSRMFTSLARAAEAQAEILRGDLARDGTPDPAFAPTWRARAVLALTRVLGPRRMLGALCALKVRGLSVYSAPHAVGHPMPVSTRELGARHKRTGGGGNLRAAVFGVNDGLVSNTSLVMGIAGTSASPSVILTTGIAGLIAGALSMASGEYVSMRSQRELYEFQIGEEREELARYPDEEAEELALIYHARGVPLEDARKMTRQMLENPEQALNTLAREELGLNPDNLGSPWGAAISSCFSFALGALVPLLPFALGSAVRPIQVAAIVSGVALFAVGAVLSLFSGRNALAGGVRMLAIGAAAGAATFGIGRILGVTLS
jgi:VIT1/CCC1 family predicted Fe2+/Mn2+ transporter